MFPGPHAATLAVALGVDGPRVARKCIQVVGNEIILDCWN